MQFMLKIKGITLFCPTFRRFLGSAWYFTNRWPGSGYRVWFTFSHDYYRMYKLITEAARVEPINPVI